MLKPHDISNAELIALSKFEKATLNCVPFDNGRTQDQVCWHFIPLLVIVWCSDVTMRGMTYVRWIPSGLGDVKEDKFASLICWGSAAKYERGERPNTSTMPSYRAVEDSSVLFAFAFQYVTMTWFSTSSVCTGAEAVLQRSTRYNILLDTVSTTAAYSGLPSDEAASALAFALDAFAFTGEK